MYVNHAAPDTTEMTSQVDGGLLVSVVDCMARLCASTGGMAGES